MSVGKLVPMCLLNQKHRLLRQTVPMVQRARIQFTLPDSILKCDKILFYASGVTEHPNNRCVGHDYYEEGLGRVYFSIGLRGVNSLHTIKPGHDPYDELFSTDKYEILRFLLGTDYRPRLLIEDSEVRYSFDTIWNMGIRWNLYNDLCVIKGEIPLGKYFHGVQKEKVGDYVYW